MASRAGAVALAAALSGCGHSPLHSFEDALSRSGSASMGLSEWCAQHKLADPPIIKAKLVSGADDAPPPDLRARLGVPPGEPIAYRHVRLTCGSAVLSQAHNWYVPSRLTPAMNEKLVATDEPFGMVAAPLDYRRERLARVRGRGPGCPPGTILSHRALLRLTDKTPLALVVECYTRDNLVR